MRWSPRRHNQLILTEEETAFYTGPSMNPTLQAKDCLRVIPYQGARIRRGDVIVFNAHPNRNQVVHRVISLDGEGRVRTRGDNNSHVDAWMLTPEDVRGRVTHALNGDRLRRIHGGTLGMLAHVSLRARRALFRPLRGSFRSVYRWLARSGVIRKLFPRKMEIRVVSFRRPDGSDELQLLLGSRPIGRLRPGQSEWYISPPFRLVVDEASLPRSVTPD